MNLRSIGIEHLNSSGAPNWDVADETEERSAALVANICKRYGIPCDRTHIIKHSEVSATACPGGLDIDKIVRRANEIMGGASTSVPTVDTPTATDTQSTGWCYFDYRGNVRERPTTEAAVKATYDPGAWVEFVGYVHGQVVNGSDKWLKSKIHGWYVHESVTGGTFGLPDLGTYDLGSVPATGGHAMTLIHDVRGNWRDQPNTQSAIFATYDVGASVACQGWLYGEDPYGDGRNRWVKSSRNGKYAWEGLFGGVYDLPYIG